MVLIADASAVINLNASGHAKDIVLALPNRLAVADIVLGELISGQSRGRRDGGLLEELAATALVDIVKLDDDARQHFEQLVVGPAIMTLDDGEAATIAYAISRKAVAVIDERKAVRICAEQYQTLGTASTVDIFAHPNVQRDLGDVKLADAVFNALYHGRMRVLPHHIDWVVSQIGRDRAAVCTSLPNSTRP